MTLYEYKMLSEDDQWDTVFSIGKFLDIVKEGNSKFVLYAIDKCFVEVEWDEEKDEIISKGVFKEGNSLPVSHINREPQQYLTTLLVRLVITLPNLSKMKRFSLYILTFLIFIACTKETIIEGTAGADGKDGAGITATVIDLAVGSEECPNGGAIVTLFADGIQFDEIVTCNGVDGEDGQDSLNVLFTTEVTATGTKIFIGHDTNGNGELDEGEVVESFEVSNGITGQDGLDGQDGYSIVFDSYRNTIEGYENETVILIGIDYNRNGVLDVPDEVIEVLKIYDGQDGADGADATGVELYDFSGSYLHESGLYSLDVSNVRYAPSAFNGGRYTFDITSNGQTVEAYFDLVAANANELVVNGIISFGTAYLALPHYQYDTIVFGGQIRDIATDNILDGGSFIKQ